MREESLSFLRTLVNTPSPVGHEARGQRVWLDYAKKFADGPTLAISLTKMSLNKILMDRINLLFDTTIAYEYHTLNSPDHLEAAKAFLEKRAPKFRSSVGDPFVL